MCTQEKETKMYAGRETGNEIRENGIRGNEIWGAGYSPKMSYYSFPISNEI